MLSKKEKCIMNSIYNKCEKKGSCLISALDIANDVFPKFDLTEIEVNQILENLVLDNYINVINSEKKGRTLFCITLCKKGESFKREIKNQRNTLMFKLGTTIILAVLSFVIGVVLKAIFS